MRRRYFMKAVALSTSAWPVTAYAQQQNLPLVGFVSGTARGSETSLGAFRRGLNENGYRDGETVKIEYRWADTHFERLPAQIADLIRLGAAIIVAGNYPAAAAARRATKTIPIVFLSGVDPVTSQLVESLNAPNRNLTGTYILNGLLEAKRLEVLHQALPRAALIGVLVNPKFPGAEGQITDLQNAARELGVTDCCFVGLRVPAALFCVQARHPRYRIESDEENPFSPSEGIVRSARGNMPNSGNGR